jgi:hypothetical protein
MLAARPVALLPAEHEDLGLQVQSLVLHPGWYWLVGAAVMVVQELGS